MIKINMSKKEIALSALTTIICHILLLGLMALMIVINTEGGTVEFFRAQIDNVVTVAVASSVLTMVVYFFFFIENKAVLCKYSKILEIYLLLGVALVLNDVVAKYVSATASPMLFFPLIACMVLRRREAIFLNSVYMLISFVFNRYLNSTDIVGGGIEMIECFAGLLTVFCGGITGIFLMKSVKTRLGSVLVGFALFIPVTLINVVMQLPSMTDYELMSILNFGIFSIVDCVLSVLLFMCILPMIEGAFSELTSFRLRELTADSAPLMKRLKQQALGTYNHSIVVAQLAEACASAIGEDAELARAVAYYHDVGKLKSPEMFAENQSEYNLHTELTPELSVDIIRSHAREGAKLIKKYKLPEIFADIAVQHHGTMPIKYFYAKALKLSDGGLNANNYSYLGPTPTSKIAAIIMICDSSEAAARSLSDRSPEKVAALVGSVVEERMNQEQFVDCDITMRELTLVTRTVINQLAGVYHSRVKYPKLVLSRK